MNWDTFDWKPLIQTQVAAALAEDLQQGSDISAELIDASSESTATLIAREEAILCGTRWFDQAFLHLDDQTKIDWHFGDGETLQADTPLCTLHGNTRILLTAERTALNFLQTLSGTATTTHEWCKMLEHTQTHLLDTRKTIPGLRFAQKYAVHCGGGHNHRLGLWDAYLIKENHIASCGSISAAVEGAKDAHPDKRIEVEVETLEELNEALNAKADLIMLDNFSLEAIQQAVTIVDAQVPLEVSGNVDTQALVQLATLGVDFISSGALTKHVRAIDFSLKLTAI